MTSGTIVVPRAGDIDKFWYSDNTEGLERALIDSITEWIGDKVYKAPKQNPNDPDVPLIDLIIPAVYAGYVPGNILSPEGILDPPSVPSVLIEGHTGKVLIGHQEYEYEVEVRIVISLWDDAVDYTGYSDARYLKEMIYFKLLQRRLLQDKYEMIKEARWSNIASGHNNYFISVIETSYKMGIVPDDSASVDADIDNDNFLFDARLVTSMPVPGGKPQAGTGC